MKGVLWEKATGEFPDAGMVQRNETGKEVKSPMEPRSKRGELAELVEEFGMPTILEDLIDISKYEKNKKGGKGTFWSWVIVHLQDAKVAAEKAEVQVQ